MNHWNHGIILTMDNHYLQTFTKTSQCALVGTTAPQCPAGWESVGYTQPGSCTIGISAGISGSS